MKSTSFSRQINKLIKRIINSLASAGYLFAPFVAMVVFAMAMGLILWTLNNQEKSQQNLALFRELAFAKQRIQTNFSENEEQLLSISKSISSGEQNQSYPVDFIHGAGALVGQHPEIVQIKWLNGDSPRIWTYPNIKPKDDWTTRSGIKEVLENELYKTFREARDTGHAQYGAIFKIEPGTTNPTFNKQKRWVFWYVIPNSKSGDTQGNIAVLYSVQNILIDVIPKDLTSRHLFSIVGPDGELLFSSSDRKPPKNTIQHEIPLDKFAGNLYLRGESYPPPSNLGYKMLLWLVIGLCLFVLWSLWSVWKQMKFRVEMQKSLIDETNFRRTIEDSMPIGIRVHDLDAKITYVNPTFCRMVGWTSDELVGMEPPYPFWPDKDLPEIMSKLRLAMANQMPKNGTEAIIVTKDGGSLSVRTFVAPLIDSKGNQRGWVSSIVDITEPKRIREELAASHQRFTTVLEGLDAAVSVVNPKNGELLFANELYRERFGNSSEGHIQLVGGEMQSDESLLLDQDSVDAFAGLPASVLTPISGDAIEIQIPKTNVWYEVRRRYLPWTDGHLAQLVIATDITARRIAEEQARIQEEKLQFSSRLTTMGEMASSLAHELNQPLAAINNYCMGVISRLKVKNDKAVNQEIIPALEKAGAQALRAGSIIQRIRGFVKRSAPQRQMCSLEQIIQDSIELAEIEAKRQGFTIHSNISKDIPNLFIDPILIQQVLVNLIKNGIDSMRSVRHIRKDLESKQIEVIADIETRTHPAMIRIRVKDHGSGIPDEVKAQIYEPFFSTKADGMGMGLNICRSIIESHSGRLWAENEHLQDQNAQNHPETHKTIGCTFTILLPMDKSVVPTMNSNKIEDVA